MEITKISDRVDALENESNDETEETKSVGAVNIEFTGDHLFSGLSDLVQSRSYGPSYGNVPPSNDNSDLINQKITKEGFHFAEKVCLKFNRLGNTVPNSI